MLWVTWESRQPRVDAPSLVALLSPQQIGATLVPVVSLKQRCASPKFAPGPEAGGGQDVGTGVQKG